MASQPKSHRIRPWNIPTYQRLTCGIEAPLQVRAAAYEALTALVNPTPARVAPGKTYVLTTRGISDDDKGPKFFVKMKVVEIR
jgi:hypothetical protein